MVVLDGSSPNGSMVPRALADRSRPAVFFDRDGVLNLDRHFVHRIEDFTWVSGAREAIALCNRSGYHVFVVTNQSGVARGFYEEADIARLHAHMREDLAEHGAHIDAIEYCPHHPDAIKLPYRMNCACRKPAPGMIETLMARFPVDRARSFLVGDKETDLQAAAAAGIPGHLFKGGDLLDFVRPLLLA